MLYLAFLNARYVSLLFIVGNDLVQGRGGGDLDQSLFIFSTVVTHSFILTLPVFFSAAGPSSRNFKIGYMCL